MPDKKLKPRKKKCDQEPLYYLQDGAIPVYAHNPMSISLPEREYVALINIQISTGVSAPKALAIMAKPCQNCGHGNVTIPAVVIPKGILSTKRTSSGRFKKQIKEDNE